jgi:hypothetical protein
MAKVSMLKIVMWRIVGEVLVGFCRRVFMFIGETFMELERSVFYLELDEARRYKALTGFDVGFASGQPHRYAGLDQARVEAVQRRMFGDGEDEE